MIRYVLTAIASVALLATVAGWLAYSRWQQPFRGYREPAVFVDVPSGVGPATIGERLVGAGVVRDALTFRGAVLLSGRARDLKAGEYRFDQPLTAAEVVDRLVRGDVYRRPITFREGLTIDEMAAVFQADGFGQAEEFRKAAADSTLVRDLDGSARNLEGYLFPETYALPRGAAAAALVEQMVSLFKRALTPAVRAGFAKQGLTVREAVTLAALVEKETAVAAERPIVAAVYLNRKKIGMPMQADPTVIYALQLAGRYDGNLRRDDLQFDSPYNTYRYPGLPPGPIAAPGSASLQAAAAPADVDFLYFVSRNDGTHVFARTLDEHNRNVQEWQIEFFRQQRRSAGR